MGSEVEDLLQFATPRQAELIRGISEHGSGKKAAEALGCSPSAITSAINAVKKKAEAKGFDTASLSTVHLKYKPPENLALTGTSTLVDGEGNVKLQWVKTKTDQETRQKALLEAIELAAESYPALPKVTAPKAHKNKDLLNVFPMGDPHIGLYAWGEEAGLDWDTDKAEKIMLQATDWLVESAPDAETALILNLGDFFHSDNMENRTSRSGHALDVDTRWSRVLVIGYNIMVRMVERALEKHKKVIVRNVIGNHDDHTAIALSVAMQAAFRNNPRVEIEMSPAAAWRMVFGKCLIAATHGDTIKGQKLQDVMVCDWPQDWGQTEHRYWYVGHIHHKSKQELAGVVVESFRTLAAKDAWHAGAGYRSGRDMYRITLHKDYGEIGRSRFDAKQFKE